MTFIIILTPLFAACIAFAIMLIVDRRNRIKYPYDYPFADNNRFNDAAKRDNEIMNDCINSLDK